MSEKSIWDNLNFTESSEKSAYSLLIEQSEYLIEKTSGELRMEVEAVDAYTDEEPPIPAALYMLYVVAPKLGNYRRKILTVTEYSKTGRFPVDIYCHLSNDKMQKIDANNFIDKIEEILSKSIVKSSIENLYRQSKEVEKELLNLQKM